jgi:hypothetical protein
MHALTPAVVASLLVLAVGPACKKKVTQEDCDRMIDRFAMLVVKEQFKDATPEQIKAEQDRERQEARGDEAFRNCTSEIEAADYACAMKAETSDTFLKCLE